MTLLNSSFAEAKRLLTHFKDAERVDTGILDIADTTLTQFRVPLYGNQNFAAVHLLYAALQAEFGTGTLTTNGDEMLIGIPGHVKLEQLPIHRLEQGLHKVRKSLLHALDQRADGSFEIDKTRLRMPRSDQVLQGIAHIDLEDLTRALVNAHQARHGHSITGAIETTYSLPKGKVVVSEDQLRHTGEVKGKVFHGYVEGEKEAGRLYWPATQAELRVQFNAPVMQALYRELGVDPTPRQQMN